MLLLITVITIPKTTKITPIIENNAIVLPTEGTGCHFLKKSQCKNPLESLINKLNIFSLQ